MNEFERKEKEIEISIHEAEATVQEAKDVQDLIANTLFHKVITEGYLTSNALRTVGLLADPSMQDVESQEGLQADLQAISYLQKYLRDKITRGKQMEAKMVESEAVLEELREAEAVGE
ncbi:MAG: hypothetical protein DRQ78_06100 [Epsilonproteobacteria bacterium]|nr:MAG: hypothetical protein DRQ78_06100 [Campylobacterota bacterium]